MAIDVHLKESLKIAARPAPRPFNRGELIRSWVSSPGFNHVSTKNKKSRWEDEMRSFKMKVLFERDLTFRRAMLHKEDGGVAGALSVMWERLFLFTALRVT